MFRRDPKRRIPGPPAGSKASRKDAGSRRGSGGAAGGDCAGAEPLDRFVLYVEGARDREILTGWARHVGPVFGRTLERSTVILGGRQPARAVDDFRRRGGASAGYCGLVVLDRDEHEDRVAGDGLIEPGLELFVWSLRHIESYLLVPAAIRRVAPHAPDDRTLAAWITGRGDGPDGIGNGAARRVGPHAKRLLGAGGALCESLGVELRAGEIARAMRRDELHQDVHDLFARVAALRGVTSACGPAVVVDASVRAPIDE
ncbi:hypothetical protein K2X89_17290 [Myxococcota bacterium]|nr:hypothetical protein [Myxococcota bacterium]